MENILQTLFVTQNVFETLGVNRIGIFGSYARGEKYADIDILLDEDPGYNKREFLKTIVEKEMNISCDVVVKNKLEPIFLYYVSKDLVYVKGK